MYCTKCQKELSDCVCPDIDERLLNMASLLIYRMCSICGKHYQRCKCDEPEWTTNCGDTFLPKEFEKKGMI